MIFLYIHVKYIFITWTIKSILNNEEASTEKIKEEKYNRYSQFTAINDTTILAGADPGFGFVGAG